LIFEALFRGGASHFWLYAVSRLASLMIMGAATALFAVLTVHEGIQTGIISAIVLPALWWIVATAETLVRRDAVDLIATDLMVVFGAMGCFLGLHVFLTTAAVATGSLSTMLMLHASRPPQFFAAAFLMCTAILLWTIIHSYLVVVRYSTIDIMSGANASPAGRSN
jgi:hypothetical protein